MVFAFVVVFTLLQSPTLPWVARKLKVSTGEDATDVEIEFAPLDTIKADMMQVHVPVGSRLHGVTIRELRLPRTSVVSLIVREGEPFTPKPDQIVRTGDDLLIVTNGPGSPPGREGAVQARRIARDWPAGALAEQRSLSGAFFFLEALRARCGSGSADWARLGDSVRRRQAELVFGRQTGNRPVTLGLGVRSELVPRSTSTTWSIRPSPSAVGVR